MHTRHSGRSSPLAFVPEIGRLERHNRIVHRASLTSSPISSYISDSEESDTESTHMAGGEGDPPLPGVDTHFRPTIFRNPSPIVTPVLNGRVFEIRPHNM
ncbi:hypothetical protein HanPSC8_Chr15g0657891 [Helianthus annuus]|nr:hypothetical protein HanPSC8_Chr15g0657891 [Helianthus annuus]